MDNVPTVGRKIFIVGEYLFPLLFIVFMTVLLYTKKIKNAYILFWIGFLLGSVWEWSHYILPNFITVAPDVESHIPGPVYNILHSLHDAMIFTIGYFLCYLAFGDNAFTNVNNSVFSFFIMFAFFLTVEVLVEIFFNRNIWYYTTDERNPAITFETNLFKTKRVHAINFWPVAEWIIASVLFWVACIAISNSYTNQ